MHQTMSKTGDCEVCTDAVGVTVTLMHGNIWMCATCKADQVAIATENAKHVILTSQKIDSTIQLKADVWNTTTTSFTELQAAILANGEIPVSEKNSVLLTETGARIKVLDTAIFKAKAELADMQTERNSLLKSAQLVHARLRENEQAKFKQFDVNYKPVAPKTIKPKAIKPPKASNTRFSMKRLKEAEATYGVPMTAIQRMVTLKGMTLDEAGEFLKKQLA